ncbi:uncharacterized protein EI90DRAFT_3052969 [Cantharellus anzutake]|uniref:uncharacterized protein n=1 Tax=Cantharellus anzutake TaxID=1750568 RepID=UPI001907CB92|nr:uncharacterized protein EI90DRAFT_3052969 [Cantharellus anzutake]KAF8333097.1 hypothetical protein EI90DRAFT_3052969 [Cantharellus anzutake]
MIIKLFTFRFLVSLRTVQVCASGPSDSSFPCGSSLLFVVREHGTTQTSSDAPPFEAQGISPCHKEHAKCNANAWMR